jgi:hypothetical protein
MKKFIIETVKAFIAPCWSDTFKTANVVLKDSLAVSIKREDSIVLIEPSINPG